MCVALFLTIILDLYFKPQLYSIAPHTALSVPSRPFRGYVIQGL
jgi:hypothetical protein